MKIIQLQFCEFIMALSINVLCKLVNFYKLCKLLNSLFYNVKKKKKNFLIFSRSMCY